MKKVKKDRKEGKNQVSKLSCEVMSKIYFKTKGFGHANWNQSIVYWEYTKSNQSKLGHVDYHY